MPLASCCGKFAVSRNHSTTSWQRITRKRFCVVGSDHVSTSTSGLHRYADWLRIAGTLNPRSDRPWQKSNKSWNKWFCHYKAPHKHISTIRIKHIMLGCGCCFSWNHVLHNHAQKEPKRIGFSNCLVIPCFEFCVWLLRSMPYLSGAIWCTDEQVTLFPPGWMLSSHNQAIMIMLTRSKKWAAKAIE